MKLSLRPPVPTVLRSLALHAAPSFRHKHPGRTKLLISFLKYLPNYQSDPSFPGDIAITRQYHMKATQDVTTGNHVSRARTIGGRLTLAALASNRKRWAYCKWYAEGQKSPYYAFASHLLQSPPTIQWSTARHTSNSLAQHSGLFDFLSSSFSPTRASLQQWSQ